MLVRTANKSHLNSCLYPLDRRYKPTSYRPVPSHPKIAMAIIISALLQSPAGVTKGDHYSGEHRDPIGNALCDGILLTLEGRFVEPSSSQTWDSNRSICWAVRSLGVLLLLQ
jgi:hypothetical protein